MPPFKLHAKFLILVLGILIVFFGVLSYIIIEREANLLSRKGAEKEHLLARTIVADLKDSMLTGRPRSTLHLMESLQGAYGLVRLAVLRKDGTYAFEVPGPRLALPQIAQAFENGRVMDFNEEGDIPLHTNIFPLPNESACRRCHGSGGEILGLILVSHSLEDTFKEIKTSTRQLMIVLAVLIVVMGTALYIAVRKVVLAPLRTLHHGSRIIGMGDFEHRISMKGGDEFSELAGSFNVMASSLVPCGSSGVTLRLRTIRRGRPTFLLPSERTAPTSPPTIMLASDCAVSARGSQVAITLPPRRMVAVSQSRFTSSSLWEM